MTTEYNRYNCIFYNEASYNAYNKAVSPLVSAAWIQYSLSFVAAINSSLYRTLYIVTSE